MAKDKKSQSDDMPVNVFQSRQQYVESFIQDVQKVQEEYGLSITVDDINPHQLVVRNLESDTIIAWLGTENIEYNTNYIDVLED